MITVTFSPAGDTKIQDVCIDTGSVKGKGELFFVQKGRDFKVTDKPCYKSGDLIVRFAAKTNGKHLNMTEKSNKITIFLGGGAIKRNFKIVPGLSVVNLPVGMTVGEALQRLNRAEGVLYAEPDYKVRAFSNFPNDPNFDKLWGMHNTGQTGGTADADIDAPEAWDIATGSGDIIVAVIDSGVDYTHPDLTANMWVNGGEIPDNDIDDDDNGYVDDVYGYDFYNNDEDPMDDQYHGTHCAGTIGAVGNNGEGVTGVCWDVRIMALKFLDAAGYGWSSDAISCIEYSVQMGARVLSNSWGGGAYSYSLKDAIDAAGEAGVLFVAAAGNDDENNDFQPFYPSSHSCDNIIAVLSTDKNDNKSDFSCYGPNSVDLGAPGSGILSCEPGNTYDYHSGTSMATPHVAGACALVLSLNPWLDYAEVKDVLLQSVDPTLPGLCISGGRLNLYQAMMQVPPPGEGFINLDKDMYSCAGEVNIRMGDSHLQGAGSYDVNVTTDGGDFEMVTLVENIDWPGSFTGTITISTEPVTVEDGTVQVTHGEIITTTYYDANDGTGNPASVQDTATVDCEAPTIFNIQVEKIGATAARISFETNEPTTGFVRYGLTCGGPYTTAGNDLVLATIHTITVSTLSSETTYYFVVDANDVVGNQTTDSNSGSCYLFTTITPVVIHVPSDFLTIRAAIDEVWHGDTVIVADGTYTGTGNRDIDFQGGAITVRSENGPNNCIIDCNGEPNEPHCGFYFHSGEGSSSVLSGFTIINGYGPLVCMEYGCVSCGGGIYCHNSSPLIDDCIIRDNDANFGGGMCNFDGSSPILNNCRFSSNSADWGGGMYNVFRSNPMLTNCTFIGNWTGLVGCGGGMGNEDDSNPTLNNCTFTSNSAGDGGGMFNLDGSSPTLINCPFRGNSATEYHGGGISNYSSNPTLTNCTFSGNWASEFGGGMCNYDSSPRITNCAFIGNLAGNGGGMSDAVPIWDDKRPILNNRKFRGNWPNDGRASNDSSDPILTNCTFFGNSASYGGGINIFDSSPMLRNCILWGDTPDEIYVVFGEIPTVTYSDVEGGFSGTGNIDADPCFVDTSSSNPDEWDYHLQSEAGRWDPNAESWIVDANMSLCIDVGDPNSNWTGELWPHGKRINMGAYGGTQQASMSLSDAGNVADLNNNDLVDYTDLMLFTDKWLHREVLLSEDLDRNGIVDFIDFVIFANHWLWEE